MITIEDFQKVDIRCGRILDAKLIPEGKYSTHKLTINFGEELGIKKSCARLIDYKVAELIGKLIVAVVNFPPRQIGKNMSEVLVLGVPDANGNCVLLKPDKDANLGGKVF